MTTALGPLIDKAVSAGILPSGAAPATAPHRPWPIVVLSFFGAWLVVLPFAAVASLLFGDWITDGSGAFVLGTGLLIAATLLLRATDPHLFLEQLAVPALLLGGSLLTYGMFDVFPESVAALTMALLSVAVGYWVCQDWLRVLSGGCAAGFAVLAVTVSLNDFLHDIYRGVMHTMWFIGLQWATVIWAGLELLHHRIAVKARNDNAGIFLDRALLGWALALLLGLSIGTGKTFLFSELVPLPSPDGLLEADAIALMVPNLLSTVAGMVEVGVIVHTWTSLLAAWFLLPAIGMTALCFALPALGPCLLILACRPRPATGNWPVRPRSPRRGQSAVFTMRWHIH